MHPQRKQRLQIIVFMLLAVAIAVALILYALRQNINLFYPPSEIAAGKVEVGQQIRAGGMVREGSVQREQDGLQLSFVVTDYEADLTVVFDGILPDMFAEGEGVVVQGVLNDQRQLIASEVLAKHDENYMPPEIAESLKDSAERSGSKPTAAYPSATGSSPGYTSLPDSVSDRQKVLPQ